MDHGAWIGNAATWGTMLHGGHTSTGQRHTGRPLGRPIKAFRILLPVSPPPCRFVNVILSLASGAVLPTRDEQSRLGAGGDSLSTLDLSEVKRLLRSTTEYVQTTEYAT